MIYAVVGFLIMFGMLVGIGINQPRGKTSLKTWCYGYLAISVVFDLLVVIALIDQTAYAWLVELLLGLSAGSATGLAIHVAHHITEVDHEEESGTKKEQKSMFGF